MRIKDSTILSFLLVLLSVSLGNKSPQYFIKSRNPASNITAFRSCIGEVSDFLYRAKLKFNKSEIIERSEFEENSISLDFSSITIDWGLKNTIIIRNGDVSSSKENEIGRLSIVRKMADVYGKSSHHIEIGFVKVREDLRGRGIQNLLFSKMMKLNPQIKKISTSLIERNKEIFKKSFENDLNDRGYLISEFNELDADFKVEIIKSAIRKTPSFKTRIKHGFDFCDTKAIIFFSISTFDVGYDVCR